MNHASEFFRIVRNLADVDVTDSLGANSEKQCNEFMMPFIGKVAQTHITLDAKIKTDLGDITFSP